MASLRVLVAAAGTGSRAGLPYPKTLFPVQGTPILVRLLELLAPLDPCPTVIVSPTGEAPVAACLQEHGRQAHLVLQPAPTGMGDAVLCFRASPAWDEAELVLLVWGDIPFIQPATVHALLAAHAAQASDFSLATRPVDAAYTVVRRDAAGQVVAVEETRETGATPGPGERDIGLFVFRPAPVFAVLEAQLADGRGRGTGEHGFLYAIRHLAARGHRVVGVPVATEQDLISLNHLKDLEGYL